MTVQWLRGVMYPHLEVCEDADACTSSIKQRALIHVLSGSRSLLRSEGLDIMLQAM